MKKNVTLVSLVAALALAMAAPASAGLGFRNDHKFLPGSKDGNEPSLAIGPIGSRFVSWQGPGEVAASPNGVRYKNKGVMDPDSIGDVTNAIDASQTWFNGQICGGGTSLHTCIYRSTDAGRHWTQTSMLADSHPGASDRPWIDVYPKHKPHGRKTWSPNKSRVYLEYHTFTPDDLAYVTVSTDGGQTFSEPKNITNDPDALNSSSCNTVPSGVTVDQRNGNVYALWLSGNDVTSNSVTGCNYSQIGPFNKAWVSTSTDGGETWSAHLAWQGKFDTVTKVGDNANKLFGSISVDRAGQVHVIVAARQNDNPVALVASCQTGGCSEAPKPTNLYLVTSPDKGAHWTKPYKVSGEKGSFFFPWIAAGSKGRVDAVYYKSSTLKPNNDKNLWYIAFAQIRRAGAVVSGGKAVYSRHPRVAHVKLRSGPVHKGGICTFGIFCSAIPDANRNLADSIAIALDPKGGATAVWTNDYNKDATSYVEDACQTSGPSAYAKKGSIDHCYRAHRG